MILQSLVQLYEDLVDQGKIDRPGWGPVKVSFALRIDADGNLVALEDLRQTSDNGKKTAMVPQTMSLPEQVKRSSGVCSNFLCDNAAYMLGMDVKSKPNDEAGVKEKNMKRARECFGACRKLHHQLLDGFDDPFAKAILLFFENWKAEGAAAHPLIQAYTDELHSANIIFQMDLIYAQQVPSIRRVWDERKETGNDGSEVRRCLVTGENAAIARLHPSIKGVMDANSTGASLISFNAPAFESYGHDGQQGLNAPVGEYAAFAYGTALNYLLADRGHTFHLGDSTIVFWAEHADEANTDFFSALIGNGNEVKDDEILSALRSLSQGKPVAWNNHVLSPDNRFYILAVSPNSARLSVRFFLQSSLGELALNVFAHQQRMEIVRPSFDTVELLPLYAMLRETVNPNSTNKNASPLLAGEVLRSVLTDSLYPESLFSQTEMRIRAENEIKRGKAAIIKAYLLKNQSTTHPIYKEVATVNLNEETTYTPYVLGRLFSVLEAIQDAANPGINTTIRDRYFNSACCTPAVVFPQLIRLSQNHLKKIGGGLAVHYQQQLGHLMGMLHEVYPARLSLPDQGVFQLGYYHQTQKRYEKASV